MLSIAVWCQEKIKAGKGKWLENNWKTGWKWVIEIVQTKWSPEINKFMCNRKSEFPDDHSFNHLSCYASEKKITAMRGRGRTVHLLGEAKTGQKDLLHSPNCFCGGHSTFELSHS